MLIAACASGQDRYHKLYWLLEREREKIFFFKLKNAGCLEDTFWD